MTARFYLYRRNGTYYFRWTIPVAVRKRMLGSCSADIRVSLRTTHYPTAQHLSARYWLASLDCARRFLVSNFVIRYNDVLAAIEERVYVEEKLAPSETENGASVTLVSTIGSAAPQLLREAIALLHDAGAPLSVHFSGPVDIYAKEHDPDGVACERVVDRLHEWTDEAILTQAGIAAAISSTGFGFDLREFVSNSPGAYESLKDGLRRYYRVVPDTPFSCLLSEVRTLPRFASLIATKASTPAAAPTYAPSAQPAPRHNESLSILAAQWLAMNYSAGRLDGWKSKTHSEYRAALEQCIKIVGDKETKDLGPGDASHYLTVLKALPRDFFKMRETKYRGKSAAVVSQLTTPDIELLSSKTLADKMGMVAQFFDHVAGQGYITKNYFKGLYKLPKNYEPQDQRDPFTDEELKLIFAGPAAAKLGKSLDNRKRNTVQFWGPLIGLYTGARAGEVSQLSAADIVTGDDGNPFLRITDSFVDETREHKKRQKVKTKQSRRDIPIHPVLLQFGIVEFAALRRKSGARVPLFPESWTRDDPDRVYQKLSTSFSQSLKDLGVKTKKLSFHSFRHTVVQRFRQNSSFLYQAHQFCGHDDGLAPIDTIQGERYGRKFTTAEMRPLLDLLDYPVDWTELQREMDRYRFW